jgi:hypothetical protein
MNTPQQPKYLHQSDFERLPEISKDVLRVFAAWNINKIYKTIALVNSLYPAYTTGEVESTIENLVSEGWMTRGGDKFFTSPEVVKMLSNLRSTLQQEMAQSTQFNLDTFKALSKIQQAALIYLQIGLGGHDPKFLYNVVVQDFPDTTLAEFNRELAIIEESGWIGFRIIDKNERWGIFNYRVKVAMDLIEENFRKPDEQ